MREVGRKAAMQFRLRLGGVRSCIFFVHTQCDSVNENPLSDAS